MVKDIGNRLGSVTWDRTLRLEVGCWVSLSGEETGTRQVAGGPPGECTWSEPGGGEPQALELTGPKDAELSQRRVFPRVSDVVAPAPPTCRLR